MTWRHIPSRQNPADISSCGCTPIELVGSKLWSEGPQFLLTDSSTWPDDAPPVKELPERRRSALVLSQEMDISHSCKFGNSFGRMQRVFEYIYRFLQRVSKDRVRHKGELTVEEIKGGTHLLIKGIQRVHFGQDHKALTLKMKLSPRSKLLSLNPFIDAGGLMRVGGRLHNSQLDFDAKHPMILHKSHHITSAIIDHFHRKFLHAGTQGLLAALRQRFWPIGGRKTVSAVINKCIQCFRLKPKLVEHIMAPLPEDRVQPNRPFVISGVDFCGPFYSKSEVRNRPPTKSYTAIFVCFVSKHYTLGGCRRPFNAIVHSSPKAIWSDNATNFVGAKNELVELRQLFLSDPQNIELWNSLTSMETRWNFIPPRSPHFGSLWEAGIFIHVWTA
ncbi:uncharacterized protein LOC122818511 [Drosophila biarmipes]|uniref:uncharacterized protein LOC122818511 n=1 Tax=Drosophila biarmipes TaxID=125945 RepID=UPI0021CC927A|nr:uncharacterized protein LOC122818511 [Drosophila biarmipes]